MLQGEPKNKIEKLKKLNLHLTSIPTYLYSNLHYNIAP